MSGHGPIESLPVPEIRLGSRAASVERIAGIIGGLCLLLCCAGFFWNRAVFFQSYLFAFIYWSGFTFGGLGILLLNNTVGGRWGVTTRSMYIAAMRTLPLILLFLIPILVLGMGSLYPWTNAYAVGHNEFLWAKRHYLNMPFFVARVIIYFAIWLFWGYRAMRMADGQDRDGNPGWIVRMQRFSAPGLLVFVFTVSFAYIDWILSADTQFYSTVYGAMVLIGSVLQTFALTVIVTIWISRGDRFGGRVNAPLLHDLGNLMFAFTIFWTYLSASQLIIVWPADLPQEMSWYMVRVHGGWKVIAAMISLVMFAVPFLALLSQARKQNPRRLIKVAFWILAARIIDDFWIVIPTWRTTGFSVYWTDAAAFLGIGGIWLYVYLGYLRKRPLLPLRDPRVMAPLPEAVA